MEPIAERLDVVSTEAASAFSKARPRAILFELMRSERSSQDLRVHLGLSLSLLNYHLEKLRQLGLIRAVRQMPRAGRPITVYRAAAKSFFVSGGSTEVTAGVALRSELYAALDRARTNGRAGTLYRLDEDGAPRMVRLSSAGKQASVGERWWRLRLSSRDADELAREIQALVSRYHERVSSSSSGYLCHFALAKT